MGDDEFYDSDQYEDDFYGEDFGAGFEDQLKDEGALAEEVYEKAFENASEEEVEEVEYEMDEVVGARDKKPVMSVLNKGKLSKYEMDDLFNEL